MPQMRQTAVALARKALSGSGGLRLLKLHIEDVRHPAELRKRTRLHLPHQVAPMHLHRGLGDADIVGNLFVQATRHDMEHDLTLAGAERVETLPERSYCTITLPTGAVASEAGLYSVKKILITERFCEKFYRAALHSLNGHRHVGMGCDEDDWHLPVCSRKVALKLKTASPRHPHVEDQTSGASPGDRP